MIQFSRNSKVRYQYDSADVSVAYSTVAAAAIDDVGKLILNAFAAGTAVTLLA
jgi:hypothetical protein